MWYCARRFLCVGRGGVSASFYSVENVLNEENLKRTVAKFAKLPPIRMQTHTPAKKAAVLIPLCVIDGEVSLLYTLRAANLKSHRGQVRKKNSLKSYNKIAKRSTYVFYVDRWFYILFLYNWK